MATMNHNIQKAFRRAATPNVWENYFSKGYDAESYAQLRIKAESVTIDFFQSTWPSVQDLDARVTNPELDNWVASESGQDVLAFLVEDIQNHIESVKEFALPAHDIRQILFKDAGESLRFYQIERPEGYKSAFVIPTFAHDIGRLLEGRFYHPDNPHDNWIPHSKFSFLMLNDILSKPEYKFVPKELKNHFLYAVLAHSGENGKTFMSRAVQACDRMQLVGPEGFFRAHAYGLCLLDADIKYPRHDNYKTDLPIFGKHHSVLSELEFFARNMRGNIGTDHKDWQRRIAVENVALLLKASEQDDDLRNRIFFPEYNKDVTIEFSPSKQPINGDVFYDAQNIMQSFDRFYTVRSSPDDVAKSLKTALQYLPGAAQLSDAMDKSILRAVTDLSLNELNGLNDTIRMANVLRMEQDKVDVQYAHQSMEYDNPDFVKLIGQMVMNYAPDFPDDELKLGDKPRGNLPPDNVWVLENKNG